MAIIPGMTVPALEVVRRRYGLFDAASGPIDLPTHGEGGGVRFVPINCGEAYAYGINCYQGEVSAPDKPLDGQTAEVEAGVFAVLSTLNCGAVGYTDEENRLTVLRRLEMTEQAAVERALWSGLDLEGNALGTLSLDGEASDIPTGYDPGLITDVVGALERYAYTDNQYGGAAYIHAPVEVAAFAAEAGLIVADGNRKVTPLGSVWVFGAYPAGSVIVTGQTAVWRAPEIQVYSAFERPTNEVTLVAERAYSVAFECFAGRAEFDPLEEVGS
jgi:hypothetical protein